MKKERRASGIRRLVIGCLLFAVLMAASVGSALAAGTSSDSPVSASSEADGISSGNPVSVSSEADETSSSETAASSSSEADETSSDSTVSSSSAAAESSSDAEVTSSYNFNNLSSASDLVKAMQIVNGTYSEDHSKSDDTYIYTVSQISLSADIDLASYCSSNEITWSGIGTSSSPLTVDFEGNGHTIILPAGSAGLISYASNITISDVTVVVSGSGAITASGSGDTALGAVVSHMASGRITNCVSLADVSLTTSSGTAYAGGIAGYASGTAISGCMNGGSVKASCTSSYAGGIAGCLAVGATGTDDSGVMTIPANPGDSIVQTASASSGSSVSGTSGSLSTCSSCGTVTGSCAGGIAGYTNSASITNCACAGTVSGSSVSAGICAAGSGTVTSCLFTGAPGGSGTSYAIAQSASSFTVTSCVYDSSRTAGATDASSSGVSGQETAALISGTSLDALSSSSWTYAAGRYPVVTVTATSNTGIFNAISAVMGAAAVIDSNDVLSVSPSYGSSVTDSWKNGSTALSEWGSVTLSGSVSLTYSAAGSASGGTSYSLSKEVPVTADSSSKSYLVVCGVYDSSATVSVVSVTADSDVVSAVTDDNTSVYQIPFLSENAISYTTSLSGTASWYYTLSGWTTSSGALTGGTFSSGSLDMNQNLTTPSETNVTHWFYVSAGGRYTRSSVFLRSVASSVSYTGTVEEDPIYDAAVVEASFSADTSIENISQYLGTQTITYYVSDDAGEWNLTAASDGAASSGGAPSHAGSYKASLSVTATAYFTAATAEVSFTISPRDLSAHGTVSSSDGSEVASSAELTDMVTDAAQDLLVTDTDLYETVATALTQGSDYTVSTAYAGDWPEDVSYEASYSAITQMPVTVTITVTGTGNYTGELTADVRISAADGWSGHLYEGVEYHLSDGWYTVNGDADLLYYSDGTGSFYATDEGSYAFTAVAGEE